MKILNTEYWLLGPLYDEEANFCPLPSNDENEDAENVWNWAATTWIPNWNGRWYKSLERQLCL